MRPYAPATSKGRTRGGDDIHHKTTDLPRSGAKAVAKVARHQARQEAQGAMLKQQLVE